MYERRIPTACSMMLHRSSIVVSVGIFRPPIAIPFSFTGGLPLWRRCPFMQPLRKRFDFRFDLTRCQTIFIYIIDRPDAHDLRPGRRELLDLFFARPAKTELR